MYTVHSQLVYDWIHDGSQIREEENVLETIISRKERRHFGMQYPCSSVDPLGSRQIFRFISAVT
jgi:hypothetical protein